MLVSWSRRTKIATGEFTTPHANAHAMIIKLPFNTKPYTVRPPGTLGRESFILHERGWRRYHWEGPGALSIKTFFNGQALYDVGKGRYAVGEDCYLILNQGLHAGLFSSAGYLGRNGAGRVSVNESPSAHVQTGFSEDATSISDRAAPAASKRTAAAHGLPGDGGLCGRWLCQPGLL